MTDPFLLDALATIALAILCGWGASQSGLEVMSQLDGIMGNVVMLLLILLYAATAARGWRRANAWASFLLIAVFGQCLVHSVAGRWLALALLLPLESCVAAGVAAHWTADPGRLRWLGAWLVCISTATLIAYVPALLWKWGHPRFAPFFDLCDALVGFVLYGGLLIWDFGTVAWGTETRRTRALRIGFGLCQIAVRALFLQKQLF